jgi:hypothetical protein
MIPSLSKNDYAMSLLKAYVAEGKKDHEIVDLLKDKCGHRWGLSTVRRVRRKFLGSKKSDKAIENKDGHNIALSIPPPEITNDQKADWFRNQYRKTHLYLLLKDQFSDDEITTYMEEYGHICCQFEDIVLSEFFQIDDFLKHRILVNRTLSSLKTLLEEIDDIRIWIQNNKPREDEDEMEKKERNSKFIQLDSKRKSLAQSNDRYDKLLAARDKIYQSLSATRKDRIDQLINSKQTFFSLIVAMKSSEKIRDKEGTYAELSKIASGDIEEQWHQPIDFDDGESEPILLDENSILEEPDDEE